MKQHRDPARLPYPTFDVTYTLGYVDQQNLALVCSALGLSPERALRTLALFLLADVAATLRRGNSIEEIRKGVSP